MTSGQPKSDRFMLRLELVPEPLALLKLPPSSSLPAWTSRTRHFLAVARTPAELSIVADAAVVPGEIDAKRTYRALRVEGPLPLHLVGIVAALAVPLAEAGVPIFPIATYDTDYLLIDEPDVARASEALIRAGHQVIPARESPPST